MIKIQNAEVSDTTGDAIYSNARFQQILLKKCNHIRKN